MKKIYMILAAITLLSMSLNAQMNTQTKSSANTKTPQVASFNFNDVLRNIKGMEGILSVNGPAKVTPFRYNTDLYNTLGPFTGDNFDYGIGFPEAYPDGPQNILVTTVLDRNEYADHIGEEIVGFRFALWGETPKTVKVSDFVAWPYNSSEGFDQNHLYEWTLTDLVGNTEPGGGDEPGETTYQYVKITSADDLTSGQYLIVCESQNVAFDGSLEASGLSATNNQASVTITNSTIESNATTDGMAFTYDATATSLQSASGYYIGRQSGTSGGALEALTSAYAHNILFSSGVPSIRCTSTNGNNTYYLRYNSDSNCFRYYTSSSQTAVQLYKKVAVNNSKGAKKANRRANRTTVTVASSDFSSSSGWTILDANNDSKTWSISGGYATYSYHTSNAANDWLVYSAIALEAGKTYTFNLDAWERSTRYPEKLEVKLATAGTATALSAGTTVIAETTLSSTSQTSPNALSNTFTVTSSGNYYIGIHATSAANMYDMYVDNMLITTESNDPMIMASTNSVDFTATPNETVTKTITVSGENLTGDITATISGTDASLFSVSPATTGGGNLSITYLPTAVGTHSATLTLSSTGAQDVTVDLTGTCSTDVTICDGTVTNNYLPIYGYYYDNVQINQMIYPSSLLTNLNGKKITSMTFYSPNLYFSGGKFTVKVGETSQASFSSAVRNTADLTATVVTDMAAPTAGGTELTITFAAPYEYKGGNLLLDFEVTETGSYGSSQTSFYGITQTGGGFNSNASSGSSTNSNGVYSGATVRNFLPKVTFAVEEAGDNNDGYVELEPGQWHEFYLDQPVTFDVEDDDDMLFMGYAYKQYPLSSTDDEVMNPAAVNSESTGHYHFVNMVAETNVAGDLVISLPGSTMNVASITVYDSNSNEITSWNATTAFNNGDYTQVTIGSNGRYNYNLPTGWSIASSNYFLAYSGDNTNYYGYAYAAGDLTIASSALNGNTTVTVVIRGMDDNGGVTVSVNGDGKTIGTNETDYTWSNVDLTATGYARDWFNIDLSEVGDLAVQLIFKSSQPVPELTAPTNGSTVDVGTNTGAGASTTVNVSGNNLTEDLTVSVTGTGFSVSPSTISAADANAGTTITVTYTGTDPNATGTLTISSGEVSVTVNLTATYVDITPVLIDPVNESTVNVGTNHGNGVSKAITISGNYLTQDLTVSVSGRGFSVSRDVTVSAADANAGTTVTVTYNGTNPNAVGTLTVSSSEASATVHLTASYSDNGEVTAADGTVADMFLPVYGSYYEEVQHNQMIYPASMLTDMTGKYITSITFYPATYTTGGSTYSGIRFYGGKVMLSLGSTTYDSFTSNAAISATVEQVAEIDDVEQDFNLTAWTFTFDSPYLYEGGNLLVQVDTEEGSYNRTYFYGSALSNMGRHQCDYSNALHDFLPKATFTYEGAPTSYNTAGMVRLGNLQIVDQFYESTAENTHPKAYKYVLRFVPEEGNAKESSPEYVDVKHTESHVNGYFTEADVEADATTYNTVKIDQMSADVQVTLPDNDNEVFYYRIQSAENRVPQEAAKPEQNFDMLTKLQQVSGDGGFYYVDMLLESRPESPAGPYNYTDQTLTENAVYGTSYKTYVPTIMTRGYDRRYFAEDSLHNTYGSPIWKTSIGKVDVISVKAEKQQSSNGSTYASWTDNGEDCNLYMLNGVEAHGYLPSVNVSNVEYVPYMFRIYVESPTNMLRGFNFVEATGNDPDHFEPDPNFTNYSGPWCIYEENIENAPVVDLDNGGRGVKWFLNKDENNWANNARFGALSSLIQGTDNEHLDFDPANLRVLFRFYYKSTGNPLMVQPNTKNATRGQENKFYGSEGSKEPQPSVGVNEILFNGQIVDVTYVNPQGMQSNRPFDGVNIVVTRYSDGSTRTTKIIR